MNDAPLGKPPSGQLPLGTQTFVKVVVAVLMHSCRLVGVLHLKPLPRLVTFRHMQSVVEGRPHAHDYTRVLGILTVGSIKQPCLVRQIEPLNNCRQTSMREGTLRETNNRM